MLTSMAVVFFKVTQKDIRYVLAFLLMYFLVNFFIFSSSCTCIYVSH
jgi:hypothetical protein